MDSIFNKPEKNDESSGADAANLTLSNAVIIQGHHNTVQNVQQGNVPNVNPLQITADTEHIREKLKDGYRSLKLPMVSWMSGGWANFLVGRHFIELQLNETIAAHSRKHEIIIPLTNIFDDVEEGSRPNRIFIESQPGFGKTTLAHKLINDWAEDEDYVRHFDLAILITLRSLKTKTTTRSIEDVVREKTKSVTNDDCNQWKMINNFKTLLVLDGLDEVDDQCKENVLQILYDTFDYKMVIVVTCRTGLFKLDDEYKDVVHGGAQKHDKFWDKKLSILGITKRNRLKFLSTFIEEQDKRQYLSRIEHVINQFSGNSDLDDEKDTVTEDKLIEYGEIEKEVNRLISCVVEQVNAIGSNDLDDYKETVKKNNSVEDGNTENAFTSLISHVMQILNHDSSDLGNDKEFTGLFSSLFQQIMSQLSGSSDLDGEKDTVKQDNLFELVETENEIKLEPLFSCAMQLLTQFTGSTDLGNEKETVRHDNSVEDGEREKEFTRLFSSISQQLMNQLTGTTDFRKENDTVKENNSDDEYFLAESVSPEGTNEKNYYKTESSSTDEIENLSELANGTEITTTTEEYDEEHNDMFKSPLLLILLAFVVERNCQIKIKTKSDLFKNLVDCLIRRCAAKRQQSVKHNFTIFVEHPNDSVANEYLELFEKFGSMAIDRILSGDLHFECISDTDKIYEMGLFIKHEQQEKMELLQHYEGFHLSILEFAAAFSIWRNFLGNGKVLLVRDRDKINDIRRQKGVTSMVIPFLFGLMGRDGIELLKQLSDYDLLYSTENDLMKLVLTECDIDNNWSAVVSNFVPKKVQFSRRSIFVNNPVLNKCLVVVKIRSSELRFVSRALSAKFLEVELDTWENINPNVIGRIKCEHLVFEFSTSVQDYDLCNLENLKKIVTISANSREVHLTGNIVILQYINSKIFENVVIDMLYVSWDREFATKIIASITQQTAVVKLLSLRLLQNIDKDVTDCLYIISKSSNIDSLIVLYYGGSMNRVNINLLTDNGRKSWALLMTSGLFVEKSLHRTCYNTIDTFVITRSDSNVLEHVAPRRLGCTHEMLHVVVDHEYQWYGLESVVELTLTFDSPSSKIPSLSYLRRFKKLKTITLHINYVETLLRTSWEDLGKDLNYVDKVRIQIVIDVAANLVTIFDYIKDEITKVQFNSSQRIVVIIEVVFRLDNCSIAESLKYVTATAPNLRIKFIFWGTQSVNYFLDEINFDYSELPVMYRVCPILKPWKHIAYFHRLCHDEFTSDLKKFMQIPLLPVTFNRAGIVCCLQQQTQSSMLQLINYLRRNCIITVTGRAVPEGFQRILESLQESTEMFLTGHFTHVLSIRNK